MEFFIYGFLAATLLWGWLGWLCYRIHLRQVQTALNLPAASSHAHVRERMKADQAFQRGPWR